jgi:hypothetical protein
MIPFCVKPISVGQLLDQNVKVSSTTSSIGQQRDRALRLSSVSGVLKEVPQRKGMSRSEILLRLLQFWNSAIISLSFRPTT